MNKAKHVLPLHLVEARARELTFQPSHKSHTRFSVLQAELRIVLFSCIRKLAEPQNLILCSDSVIPFSFVVSFTKALTFGR